MTRYEDYDDHVKHLCDQAYNDGYKNGMEYAINKTRSELVFLKSEITKLERLLKEEK